MKLIIRGRHWLRGYVKFQSTGGSPEGFLNSCNAKQVDVWGTICKSRLLRGYIPAAVLLPHKGERNLPTFFWADPSCFYVCSHEAISRIFASASPGPSMRIAPPKVNTHEKNGGVGATSTVARKWLASTTSVSTSSPK